MTTNGYIPFPRALFSDPIWKEPRTYTKAEALADLYQRAAYSPHEKYVDGKLVQVGLGEVVDSVRYLAEAWGWAKSTVHDFLKRLEKAGHISVKTRTGLTVVTVTFSATYYNEANESRTAAGQQPDSSRTAAGQQPDKREEDKEYKEEKEGEVAAPIHSSQFTVQSSNPTAPGTTEFALLRRIGKPAAQIWTQAGIESQFATPNHADLALQWMEYRTTKGKPYTSHQEIKALIEQYNRHTTTDLLTMMNYSMTAGYTALYPDRLQKAHKATNQQRLNLDPTDLEKTRQNVHVTSSGLKLVK